MKKFVFIVINVFVFLTLTGFRGMKNYIDYDLGIVYEDNDSDTYIIGDSRIFHMRNSLEEASDFNWIGISGSGYYHLINEMVPTLNRERLRGKTIIVESGLNDILFGGGIQNAYIYYYDFYNNTAQKWIKRGAKVKMVRVLPIAPWSESNIEKNRFIQNYNDILQVNIPANIEVIDLNQTTLEYFDELHFKSETSRALYKLLKEQN